MGEVSCYEVKKSQQLGRYLVASRDIEPREVIIREDPLMTAPTDRVPKDVPACLGCNCVMNENSMNRCQICYWPVCNEECEKLPVHASNECVIFSKNRVIYPPPYGHSIVNKSIFILRCLLLKSNNPLAWEHLMSMSDNKELRSNKPNCIHADKKILENFAKFFPSGGFTREEVIRISGIIDVNCHAFPLRIKENLASVCNLYRRTSLMAHSCRPNASWSADKSFSSLTLTIRANVPISKGEIISVAYDEDQLLVCTLKRLIPNEINGMFICHCDRCLDPTEMGTYIGAIKCSSCAQGHLLPIDPVDSFSSWKCDNARNPSGGESCRADVSKSFSSPTSNGCSAELDDELVMEIIEDAEMMCGYTKVNFASDPEQDESLDLLKEFLKEYGGNILHPNHYILQEVNVRILRGEYAKGLSSLSNPDLIQYLERCESLLSLADAITPGYCEHRAFLQFHFSQGLLALEGRRTEQRDVASRYSDIMGVHEGNKDGNCIKSTATTSDNVVSEELQPDEYTKYGGTLENLEKLMKMLSFLITYFKEINSTHKLLQPILETIKETEMQLQICKSNRALE